MLTFLSHRFLAKAVKGRVVKRLEAVSVSSVELGRYDARNVLRDAVDAEGDKGIRRATMQRA
jgi:hypothetical protein